MIVPSRYVGINDSQARNGRFPSDSPAIHRSSSYRGNTEEKTDEDNLNFQPQFIVGVLGTRRRRRFFRIVNPSPTEGNVIVCLFDSLLNSTCVRIWVARIRVNRLCPHSIALSSNCSHSDENISTWPPRPCFRPQVGA